MKVEIIGNLEKSFFKWNRVAVFCRFAFWNTWTL